MNSRKDAFFEKNPVLRNKEFRAFLSYRFGMAFALSMQFTIVAYWIFQLTGSKMALGLIGLAEVIPVIAFSLFSGYLVDLREKRKLVVTIVTGYIFLGMGLFYLTTNFAAQHLNKQSVLVLIYTCIFLGGVLRTFLGPASFSLVGLIIPRAQYANGTSWYSMAFQVGNVLGPLTSGAVIAIKGVEAGMAIVFILEIFILFPVLYISVKPILKTTREPVFRSIGEGLKFVIKTPELLGAQLLDMFSVLFGGAVALLPAVQQEYFPAGDAFFSGATAYGFLRAGPGIGALVTLVLLAFLPLRNHPGRKLFLAVTGFGLAIIVFGLSRNFYLSFFMLILSGLFDAVSVVIRSTILQLVTPDEMRGRVSSVNTMFISSSNELGDFESGVMAHWLGTSRAIVVGGCITLLVVLATFAGNKKLKDFKFHNHE